MELVAYVYDNCYDQSLTAHKLLCHRLVEQQQESINGQDVALKQLNLLQEELKRAAPKQNATCMSYLMNGAIGMCNASKSRRQSISHNIYIFVLYLALLARPS